jgi:hypothetical protein
MLDRMMVSFDDPHLVVNATFGIDGPVGRTLPGARC